MVKRDAAQMNNTEPPDLELYFVFCFCFVVCRGTCLEGVLHNHYDTSVSFGGALPAGLFSFFR